MSLFLIRQANIAEQNDEYHISRLLVLLVSQKSYKPIAGITKLVKLDFLLRYPNCLERALESIDYSGDFKVSGFEKTTIESKMVRFKYGPWDDRYRRWIGVLQAKGLVNTYSKGKTVYVEITPEGIKTALNVKSQNVFKGYSEKSEIIMKHFNKLSATALMKFIYKTFPELEVMKWGEKILI
ncbi:hypothetical protein ACFL49_00995 [Candidatus Omnitrophota bacterium]